MKLTEQWPENGRILQAVVLGRLEGEAISIERHLTILVPGEIEHPRSPGAGANAETLIERNGRYGVKLWLPLVVAGRKVEVVAISEAQYRSCQAWLEDAGRVIREALTTEREGRETIVVQWGQPGFAGEDDRRGQLIEAELTLADISWLTDWDAHNPHSATFSRALWREMEPRIQAELNRQNAAIERRMNDPDEEGLQLWEPCERCGAQPSYTTSRGHLCERCR